MSSDSITDLKEEIERYIWDLVKFKSVKFDKVSIKFFKTEEFNLIGVLNLIVDSNNEW